jgi:hypothetical protein
MIEGAKVQAAEALNHAQLELIATRVSQFVGAVKRDAADGKVTVAEFGRLTVLLIKIGIVLAEPLAVPGANKKAIVIDAVAKLFDAVADKCVPTISYPAWLVVRSSVRSIVLAAAGGALETILPMVLA